MNQFEEEENQYEGAAAPILAYYHWLTSGWAMPLKFIWTGIIITALLLLKFEEFFFALAGGFLIRELYMIVMYPEYEGHWIWRKLDPEET